MNDEALLRTSGLSGDHGWNDDEESSMGGLSTAVLVVAASLYWGSLWLLAGLPPVLLVADRVRMSRSAATNRRSTGQTNKLESNRA